jgi:hypothetical protein
MKLAHCGWTILLLAMFSTVPAAIASSPQPQSAPAQKSKSQTDPLAAAARRAREKQKEEPKPAKVWDNDNIPAAGGVDVVGANVQSSSAASAENGSPSLESPADTGEQNANSGESSSDLEAQLKSAKADLKSAQSQLDFQQRKFALDQQNFYRNPNYASDDAGAKALQDEQNQIDAKKQNVAAAQKKVDDLTAKVNAAAAKDSKKSAK